MSDVKYCVDCRHCDIRGGASYKCRVVFDLVTKHPMDCKQIRETKCGVEGRLFKQRELDSKGSDAGSNYSEKYDIWSDEVFDDYRVGIEERSDR